MPSMVACLRPCVIEATPHAEEPSPSVRSRVFLLGKKMCREEGEEGQIWPFHPKCLIMELELL